jgi:hypothetical protein
MAMSSSLSPFTSPTIATARPRDVLAVIPSMMRPLVLSCAMVLIVVSVGHVVAVSLVFATPYSTYA